MSSTVPGPAEGTAPSGSGGIGGTPPQPGVVPTCYRHPGRETYISCTRCERPICSECMIPAAVGFQCPECVRSGRQGQRIARTAFGGRVAVKQGAVTYSLIALNVVLFLVQQASSTFQLRYELIADLPFPAPYAGVANGEYYRLVTSMFLHANVLHILFNMWALYVVGMPLEAMFGRLRYTVLYFLSGLAGSALVYLLAAPTAQTLGASGAIFGLFGALFVVARRLNFDIRPIGFVIVLNLVLTFTVPGISWQGHVGGLVAGSALAAAWVYAPRKQRTLVQVTSSLAVAALIAIVVVARTHALTG